MLTKKLAEAISGARFSAKTVNSAAGMCQPLLATRVRILPVDWIVLFENVGNGGLFILLIRVASSLGCTTRVSSNLSKMLQALL